MAAVNGRNGFDQCGRIALRMGELIFAFTDGYSEPLPNIVLHENVIMPNHVHGIWNI